MKNKKKMEVSIGIPAYNEENNIVNLLNALLNQKLNTVRIKEIIVVSDGSTDSTVKKVRLFIRKNKKAKKIVRLISYKNRRGKWFAINRFLKAAKSEFLVLSSADIIPKSSTIESLCKPLLSEKIGVVASHIIPTNPKNTYLGFTVNLIYKLHHEISKISPKFGEMIAFKHVFKAVEKTAVDEEYIASMILSKGFYGFYAEDAVVYNHGVETINDYIKQRRRIYCGHLELKKKKGYKAPTMNNLLILRLLMKELNLRSVDKIVFSLFMEGVARFLGMLDYYRGLHHYKWDVAKSTKKIPKVLKER